jgi:hypothetical protein
MSDSNENDPERRVRERAYHLWLQSGSPEGRSEEFWHEARRLEDEMRQGGVDGAPAGQQEEKGVTESLGEALPAGNVPPHRGVP